MAELKKKTVEVETADQKMVRRELKPTENGLAAMCGGCGRPLVSFDGRTKCRFCWYCGREIKWR